MPRYVDRCTATHCECEMKKKQINKNIEIQYGLFESNITICLNIFVKIRVWQPISSKKLK